MFKSSTEGVNSLTVDDVARQAVPESGTSSTEGSIANSHKPRSWHLQTMRLCRSEPAPAGHIGLNGLNQNPSLK